MQLENKKKNTFVAEKSQHGRFFGNLRLFSRLVD